MRKFFMTPTLAVLGLTLASSLSLAQTQMRQAPIPGPYMVVQEPAPMPGFTPQRFAMPMPYWMQQPQPQQNQMPTKRPVVGRAQQQPASTGWNAGPMTTTPNSLFPAPDFFPGYKSGQPQNTAQPQHPPTNYGSAFPSIPWGQQGGQQGFMPMQAPWQQGQNGWGNTWSNNGYGQAYGQGYGPQNNARNQGRQ